MYKLLKSELKILDNYWKFIEIFQVDKKYNNNGSNWDKGVHGYRKELIMKIRENYTAEEFYEFEMILNKLLWNLIEHIGFNIDNIEINIKSQLFMNMNKFNTTISIAQHDGSSYSFKQFLYNQKLNIRYYFNYYSEINKIPIINKIFNALSKRSLYEKVMNDKKYIQKIKPKIYYYPFDYPFPNINLIFYNENFKELWINRIKKLYFYKSKENEIDYYWYGIENYK